MKDRLTIESIDWEVYFEQARLILKEGGIPVDVRETMKGLEGTTKHVYIECFPVKSNKRIIEMLEKLADFQGSKYLGLSNTYWYSGYFKFDN